MSEKDWRMIIEFTATNEAAGNLSRAVRKTVGPACSVKTVEVWMHDVLLRSQHAELVDTIHELKRGMEFFEGTVTLNEIQRGTVH